MESSPLSPPACPKAAQCLRERKRDVLARWESRARHELPAAANAKHYHLLDSLPQFLDELIRSLERGSPRQVAIRDVAESHATQRAGLGDYTLEQVQAEYTILRQILLEILEENGVVDPLERDIVRDFVVESRMVAATEYLRVAQSQIRWSGEYLALALDSAGMGTFDWDIPRGRATWSPKLIQLYGFAPGQFSGRIEDIGKAVHPDDLKALERAIDDSVRKRQDFRAEYRVIWPDGGTHWITAQGRPYYDQDGKPLRMIGVGFEITERKQAEEAIRRSNEAIRNERAWYEMALNSVPTPIILLHAATREVIFRNDATRKLQTLIPTVLPENGHPEVHAFDRDNREIPPDGFPRHRVLRGEVVRDFEMRWDTPQGTVYVLLDGKPLPAAHGHPAGGVLSFRDISPIKEVEEGLRQSEAKFRVLFESNLVGIVFGDVKGGMHEMNDYFLKTIGYSREEILQGKVSWVQLTPPEYLHLDEQAMAEMDRRGYCSPYEKPFVHKDGSWVWVTLTAIFTDKSHFRHVAIVIDITERKRFRENLEERERELRLLTESIPQIVWTASPDASIQRYNQNWYSYTGFSTEMSIARAWEHVLHPEDVQMSLEAWQAAQSSGQYVVEHRVRRYDGRYRWFLSRARPIRDDQGKIVRWFGTSTDIEDQKRAQQGLEQEKELRDQFVSTLSHDLRNPLSAARTCAQMIARNPDRIDRTPSLANRITDSLDRADKMIEDLLDANRIRAGKGLPIELEKCDLSRIAEKVCEELSSIHGDRFIRRFPKSVEGNWSCRNLYRLLENLLTNAIKYGFKDTPVTLTISERHSAVEIAVHNFGEPIPPDERSRLFDPFVRSRTVGTSQGKGWGLGLTLVRGVAEAHGGHVEVESGRGTGTTFRVTIPKDARLAKAG